METVEVVIRIPKDKYDYMIANPTRYNVCDDETLLYNYIKDGTVLPKGHGRLIDGDAATKDINAFQDAFAMYTDNIGKYNIVCAAPTVIEADKGVANENTT